MTKKHLFSIIFLLCLVTPGMGQRFFNLTADEVKIDSLLPFFSHSIALGECYKDSTYNVTIEYAEYIDMTHADVTRYKKITSELPPPMPEISANVVTERKRGHLEISFTPIVFQNNKYRKLVSFMLDVESKAKKKSLRTQRARMEQGMASRYAQHSVLATGKWAKIRVPSSGIYQLTDALIRKAGFSNLSKVKIYGYGGALQNEAINEADIVKYDDLKEVATCTVNGKRLFFAQGPVSWKSKTETVRTRNPYSDYGYYLITQNDNEPLSIDSASFINSVYPSFDDYHTLHEVDNYAWYHGGRNLFESSPIKAGGSKTYAMNIPVSSDKGNITSGTLSVCVTAGMGAISSVSVSLNDSTLGVISIVPGSYTKAGSTKRTFNISNFKAENNITISTTSGGPVRLDYIAACHDTPRPCPDLVRSTFESPEYVYNITNQDLHGDGAFDMVIIVPASGKLNAQARRLKEFHEQRDGLRVRLVPADELFNEFSSGTPDANAYRRYMKMLYDRAGSEADMPKYLLLFGDGAWDNRMNSTEWKGMSPDDFLLCFESENSFSETDCYTDDGFFCLLDDGEGTDPLRSDKLDVAVGRFPVRNEHEAKTLVDKTINYITNKNAGAWQNVVMMMGDDGNNNMHMEDADAAAKTLERLAPGLHVKRVMWDAYTRVTSSTGNSYPDATKAIKQQQAAGALIMNYSGHGRADQISHERVLIENDFATFNNANYPLWITASCDIMPFDAAGSSIGEVALLNEKGGTMAFYGTTRTVWTDRNKAINLAFLTALMTKDNDKYISIGEAQRRAKNNLIISGQDRTVNKLHYALLGDPALVLNTPLQKAVIDSINGIDVRSGAVATMKAGSIVSVSGHIERDNTPDTSFNGTMTATVRDSERIIECKLNDESKDGSSWRYQYADRTKTLFNGSDSVRSGRFTFTFAVPKDINYSDDSGLINIFALSNDKSVSANGECDKFVIGGTDISGTDSIGPSIYCYLNSPSFTNGGDVNITPYFVAQIKDKDGINTTGNGIGHDLQLIIDGDMTKTYNLNDNFQYDFGSYTSGTTFFNIPELAPGKHKLKFRAWDILNNSSTTELSFNVVRGLRPDFLSVSCTENPARLSTTFIINHDRAGSNMDVEIEVFDISGRPLWKHTENGVAANGAYTIDWDLTANNGGKLQTGVYVYRIRISSDGSTKVSKAKKLIIINN